MKVIGIDIGGTKCAVITGSLSGQVYEKTQFPTSTYQETFLKITGSIKKLKPSTDTAIGISCGGPLDAINGIIQAPPNLPDWVDIPIVDLLKEKFDCPVFLMNDANACALAEWKFGAGIGSKNMAFLTFGTGLGAGLILNERLYEGATGDAGELGHIRLATDGPLGYHKKGSFEGFCSGGGIPQVAQMLEKAYPQSKLLSIANYTTKEIAQCAFESDPLAIKVFEVVGEHLGKGLSILIDLLNLDTIVIGSIYSRCHELIKPKMEEILQKETLPRNLKACQIKTANLGDSVGDMATLAIVNYYEKR